MLNIDYYQTIPDVNIKGRMNTPEEFEKIGMPLDLKGKSVLDIGCNTGAFLIEAWKRGATEVVGIEPDANWRYLARGITTELSIPAHIFETWTEDFVKEGTFDVVMLLSVLHVCEDPQQVIEDAWRMTKGLLILEINDRLQKDNFRMLAGGKFIGKNKDNRSVWHFYKNG